jgi:hypothetical protein
VAPARRLWGSGACAAGPGRSVGWAGGRARWPCAALLTNPASAGTGAYAYACAWGGVRQSSHTAHGAAASRDRRVCGQLRAAALPVRRREVPQACGGKGRRTEGGASGETPREGALRNLPWRCQVCILVPSASAATRKPHSSFLLLVNRSRVKCMCALVNGRDASAVCSADGCRCELPAKFLPRISADGDGAGTLQMTSLPDDQGRRRILATRAGGDSEGAEPFWRRLTPKDSIEHSPGIAGDIKLS